MAETNDNPMLVSLDIGTSKVVAMVAEVPAEGDLRIAGVSCQPSRGLKRGMIVDIESTVQSIKRAIEEAELMADCKMDSVTVGIGGNHISSLNSHGIVAIDSGEVTETDIDRVIDAARAVAIAADQKILHILPQEYVIDGQDGIRDPLGMSGVRLEVKVHIIIGSSNVAQNIEKCLARCDLQVDGLVVNQLASSEAVLTEDEKELGVCLIDMGGGTLDLAVYTGGAIRHTAVIPVAGDQVTNDIAMALRTPTIHAEDIDLSNEAVERLGCDYTGEDMEIGFNSRLLIEMLQNLSTPDIIIELSSPSRAGIILPSESVENENLLMLLMPMMIAANA